MTLHHAYPIRCVGTFILLAALCGEGEHSGRRMSWDFEADQPGEVAEGFLNESGDWRITLEGDNHVLSQKAENRLPIFNITLIEQASYRDVELSVRVRAVAGENERGGGLIWRAKDKNNYYVARYNPFIARNNPKKPNFRLYKVENGKRTQLDHADVAEEKLREIPGGPPGEGKWHTLRITMRGSEILGYLDGEKFLEAEDATFLDVGRIGLWTKSDACPHFDDLTVSTFTSPEEQK